MFPDVTPGKPLQPPVGGVMTGAPQLKRSR